MPTEPVLPESELHSRVLQRIADGRLPCVLATRIDAGYGTGVLCDACEQSIAPDKVEYDVTDPDAGRHTHFHFGCHATWQRECARRLKDFPSNTVLHSALGETTALEKYGALLVSLLAAAGRQT